LASAAAAEEALESAERAARLAFDAVSNVSIRNATMALRERGGFILDARALEDLRSDVGISPARIVDQLEGETFFVPAGCPRFCVALRPHTATRWFFLSPGSVAHALRLAQHTRFLPNGHPERGDSLGVRRAVIRAAFGREHGVARAVAERSRGAPSRTPSRDEDGGVKRGD
jgi:hypothetical protein